MASWKHFDAQRTKAMRGETNCLLEGHVSLSMPSNSTHWDHIHAIADQCGRPFKVKFVSDRLKDHRAIRGRVFFGYAGNQIQQIMVNYPTLRWWMEADGLVIDEPSGEIGALEEFDRVAGELVISKWTDKRLSKDDFITIAKQLDEKGYKLSSNLQKAQWEPIAAYNQKYARKAIRTFEAAANDARFARSIRRRLYLARDRYRKAIRPVTPIYVEY